MTKKSLTLGVVALCALPVAGHAQVLLSEDFDTVPLTALNTPGPLAVGPDFTGRFFGIINNTLQCTSPASGHCLVLNGGAQTANSLTSIPVTLEPGTNYVLSFDMLSNRSATAGSTSSLMVSLGGFTKDISLTNNGLHGTVGSVAFNQVITVPSVETVDLVFKGVGTTGPQGPVLDNIVLEAPEPATLGLMALGLLGGAVAGFARRKRPN